MPVRRCIGYRYSAMAVAALMILGTRVEMVKSTNYLPEQSKHCFVRGWWKSEVPNLAYQEGGDATLS